MVITKSVNKKAENGTNSVTERIYAKNAIHYFTVKVTLLSLPSGLSSTALGNLSENALQYQEYYPNNERNNGND